MRSGSYSVAHGAAKGGVWDDSLVAAPVESDDGAHWGPGEVAQGVLAVWKDVRVVEGTL